MIELDRGATLHHVFKGALLWGVISSSCSKVSGRSFSILWMRLRPNWRSSIIGLIPVRLFSILSRSSSLRKSPFWEILFAWRIRWSLWDITAWPNWGWSRSLIFEATSSSVTEGVLWLLHYLRLVFRKVLRSRSSFKIISLHLIK